MQALSANLRNQLERTVIAARDAAEVGAWAALERLAVNKAEARSHMTREQRDLRVKLRAKGRQLGDKRKKKNGEQDICYLHQECAYEYWHQMLFARFLAENQLLIHPDMQVPVTLEECEELAADEGTDGWTLAARYASRMLPQIFRPDDPLLGVTYAPEDKQALEKLLARLPVEVFTAEDSLGWVYQFWQTKRKKEVNDSGEKIGADELPAVTQLFTEDYMVKFLLHNTLGAWWAGKVLADEMGKGPERSEDEWRDRVALPGYSFDYLRFLPDGTRAAGTFPDWPTQAAELKIMDPCCGSGHFLVAAFDLMVRIRMEEEGLEAVEACDAVLRDNLFGLEIDPRCTQIAAFALAFAAWTFPEARGYRALPELHIACTGVGPQATQEQWIKLAEQSGVPMPPGGREPIRNGLINLHRLFSKAPTLGSLIDPNQLPADLIAADYETLGPYLAAALTAEHTDEETYERAVAAHGIVKAAELLASDYTLVITNVPYLGYEKQDDVLKGHLNEWFSEAKKDLAAACVVRCLALAARRATIGVVTSQYWLFLRSYVRLRKKTLTESEWNFLARLGPGAFETISGEVVNVALVVASSVTPTNSHSFFAMDVVKVQTPNGKATALREHLPIRLRQAQQYANPDHKIITEDLPEAPQLSEYAITCEGLHTGDYPRFGRKFWEMPTLLPGWALQQAAADSPALYGGREHVLFWESGSGALLRFIQRRLNSKVVTMWVKGEDAWGRRGVSVSAMSLRPTLYTGEVFTHGCFVIVPKKESDLAALWHFCCSEEFVKAVRALDHKVCVARSTFDQVPFDVEHWRRVARDIGPLPEPTSDNPSQWVFHGDICAAENPLQVAVAQLVGFRWPMEPDGARAAHKLVDDDGIVCVPAVSGEATASDRLLALLSGRDVSPDKKLDDWFRDKFFVEHCQLFHQRPFIWHIWDGRRKDGFHALVNYHKLDRKLLEKLIYGHLGDWISRQKGAESRGESGAEARRLAAEDLQERLKVILEGKPPYDIFVRWKPLQEQPIGWDPDLNDGVRINIRPFVTAGVLRKNPRIKWKKDRGKEPARDQEQFPWFWEGGEFTGARVNDIHLTLAEKKAARENAKKK